MRIRYVQRVKRPGGREDLYFRKGDYRRGPLRSPDNSEALRNEVEAILAEMNRAAGAANSPTPGTVRGALMRYNASAEFIGLQPSTKKEYQYRINELIKDCGDIPLSQVTYAWLKEMQDIWATRGHKACNDIMQVLKNALKPEMAKGTVPGRPFAEIKKLLPPTNREEPHLAWRDHEVAAAIDLALASGQPGLARAIALGRWGGFRRGAICAIPLQARQDGLSEEGLPQKRLYWITPKRNVLSDKPEDSRLTDLLQRTPNRALTIAYNARGQPWKKRSLNQALTRLVDRLHKEGRARTGLDLHGLRHARGMELAYSGASEFQIMAQLEHSTSFAARIYMRQALRARGANAGQVMIDNLIRVKAEKAKGG